jgi:dihydroxyacetone kinase
MATAPAASTPIPEGSRRAAATAVLLLQAARDSVAARVDELGALDAVAGDGDHGVGMLRGLDAAVSATETLGPESGVRALLQSAGDAWSERAGGTSGALWGAALAELGRALGDREAYELPALGDAVSRARLSIAKLGGAEPGDKTMLDAILPFEAALHEGVAHGLPAAEVLDAAVAAASAAAEASASLRPRRGRARPLAERSVGHPDPGAVSFSIIVASARDALHHLGRRA